MKSAFEKANKALAFKWRPSGSPSASRQMDFCLSKEETFNLRQPSFSTTQARVLRNSGCWSRNALEQ